VNVVKDVLLEVAASHPETLAIPQSQVFFTGLGDSSLDFELLVWIDAPSHQASIKSDLYFRIEAILKKHNIEIPFPQRDLHLRSGDLPLKLSPELEQALLRYSQQQNQKNG
jgi:small-conductance mechanosensitive channel